MPPPDHLRRPRAIAALIASASLLAACATSPGGRDQLVAPQALQSLTSTYSDVDMRLRLALISDQDACRGTECLSREDFDERVDRIGAALNGAAFHLRPELAERFPKFDISVIEKAEPGFASSASGTIVVFRGTAGLGLTEAELEFAIAREMAHVIDHHHDENITVSIVVSILAQLFLPIFNVANGAAALVSSSTLQTTAVATAASMAGSSALKASFRPAQVAEADHTALALLAGSKRDCREIADSLQILASRKSLKSNDWEREMGDTIARVAGLLQGPPEPLAAVAASDERDWQPGYLVSASLPDVQLRWANSPF